MSLLITSRLRAFVIFAVASLIAVACGALTLKATGHPFGSWIRNPVAWLVGLVIAAGLMRTSNLLRVSKLTLVITFLAITGTFLAPAQSGVHRWIDAGPLHINIAALALPSAIVALAFIGVWTGIGLSFAAAIATLLVLQPDASQTTSFLVAVMVLLSGSTAPRALRLIAIAAALLLSASSWARPDPLQPVAEVEGIFGLARTVSPLLAIAAALALTTTFLAPLASVKPRAPPTGLPPWHYPATSSPPEFALITAPSPCHSSAWE